MSKRTNKILPAALATTLAFGAAPFAVSADVDLEAIDETYPATAEWTEDDWNTYLGENYGTDLSAYESNDELFDELGEPVDVNAWISDQSDANILEAMERYGVTSDELATILENSDNMENIHFVGDLENVLEDEGFTEVASGEGTTEETTEEPVDEETAIDDEVADAEVYDDSVVESEGEDEIVDDETAEDSEEVAAAGDETGTEEAATEEETTKDGEVIEEGLDMTMVEETYLTPYGWTEDDFNTYLMDNYDMELADFNDFAELEDTVGPLLDDETLSATLYEYDLTEDEYNTFLEDNGFTEDDFVFVADLEWALEDAGFTIVNEVEGEEMPDTATNAVQNALIGTGIALLGAAAFFVSRRREGEQ